jgi:hypothetical protein
MTTARATALRLRSPSAKLASNSYRSADTQRSRNHNDGARGGSGDRHVDDRSRDTIRELSRSMERNAHEYAVFLSRWCDDLGTPWPRFTTSDPELNKWLSNRFRLRAGKQKGGFDSRQLNTWSALVRLWQSHLALDGDVFVLKLDNGTVSTWEAQNVAGGPQPNQYRRTTGGLRLDADGAPTAVYLAPNGTGGFPDKARAKEYPVEQAFWFLNRTRHSQTRGLPPLVSALDDIERVDALLESTVISGEQASNVYGAIKGISSELARNRGTGFSAPVTAGGKAAPIETSMNPADNAPDWVDSARGSLLMLYDNQEYQPIAASHPNTNVPPFMISILRMIGMGLSYPYEVAFMDMNTLSWSAGKTLITLARTGMERWRNDVFEPGLSDFLRWWLEREIDDYTGIVPTDFATDQFVWDWPELPWPDPIKEETRNRLAFDNQTDSPQRLLGHHWADIREENAQADLLTDKLTVVRLAELQKLIDIENAKNPNLKMMRAEVLAILGAKTAPGAFLQGAAQQAAVDNEIKNGEKQGQEQNEVKAERLKMHQENKAVLTQLTATIETIKAPVVNVTMPEPRAMRLEKDAKGRFVRMVRE